MEWVRGEVLGRGNFATVSLAETRCRNHRLSPLMAVKSCGFSQCSSLMNEKVILEEMKNCPEVIRCFGESFTFENGEKLYNVLLEYASGGTMADKVRESRDRRLPEMDVRQHARGLLKGLSHIHKLGYVHCDIKLQNILLSGDGGVKIADFGLAKRAVLEKGSVSGCELRGTPRYMSPEMVAGGEQGTPADIWAFGCAVAEMVSGAPAWRCSELAGLLMRIGVGEELPLVPDELSCDGKDFLGKCFVKDPSKRWTAEMLLDHPFVVGDQEFDGAAAATVASKSKSATSSPRCPFEFPDWASSETCSSSPSSPPSSAETGSLFSPESNSDSPADRLIGLNAGGGVDWSATDDWVTIR